MNFSIYADLPRPLTSTEREAVFAAIDEIIPGSGCVGRQKGPTDEVYFCVDAPDEAAAREQARRYVDTVLTRAGLPAEYELHCQFDCSVDREEGRR